MSFTELIGNVGVFGGAVMACLALLSIISVGVIVDKYRRFRLAQGQSQVFKKKFGEFLHGGDALVAWIRTLKPQAARGVTSPVKARCQRRLAAPHRGNMLFIALVGNLTLVLFRPILRYGSRAGTAPR